MASTLAGWVGQIRTWEELPALNLESSILTLTESMRGIAELAGQGLVRQCQFADLGLTTIREAAEASMAMIGDVAGGKANRAIVDALSAYQPHVDIPALASAALQDLAIGPFDIAETLVATASAEWATSALGKTEGLTSLLHDVLDFPESISSYAKDVATVSIFGALPTVGQSLAETIGLLTPTTLVAGAAAHILDDLSTSILDDLRHILPKPGTPYADLDLLQDADADPASRLAALHRMADRVPWSPRRNPRVWRELTARAKHEGLRVGEIVHRELCTGLWLALGDKDRPQTHRFGREWLKTEDGKKVAIAPDNLPMDYFWDWLFDEAISRAEAALLDEPYPRPPSDAMERSDSNEPDTSAETLRDDRADPLLRVVDDEEQQEDTKRLLAVLERATGQQRQLLALIARGQSLSEAARLLGIKPATARVHMHRLRRAAR